MSASLFWVTFRESVSRILTETHMMNPGTYPLIRSWAGWKEYFYIRKTILKTSHRGKPVVTIVGQFRVMTGVGFTTRVLKIWLKILIRSQKTKRKCVHDYKVLMVSSIFILYAPIGNWQHTDDWCNLFSELKSCYEVFSGPNSRGSLTQQYPTRKEQVAEQILYLFSAGNQHDRCSTPDCGRSLLDLWPTSPL